MSEVGGSGAGEEIAVGIVPRRQLDDESADTGALEARGDLVGSLLTGLVIVLVESDIDGTARLIGELRQLSGC